MPIFTDLITSVFGDDYDDDFVWRNYHRESLWNRWWKLIWLALVFRLQSRNFRMWLMTLNWHNLYNFNYSCLLYSSLSPSLMIIIVVIFRINLTALMKLFILLVRFEEKYEKYLTFPFSLTSNQKPKSYWCILINFAWIQFSDYYNGNNFTKMK